MEAQQATMPPRLRRGDCVRLVSPASPPDRTLIARGAEILAEWGLRVEIGTHAFDRMGHYLAGRDEDRLEDVNEALRDPAVRAIFATRGGKGSYRIAHGLDFDAARRDPKPLIGFSDITILHLALWQRSGVGGIHRPRMEGGDAQHADGAAEGLRRALMDPSPITITQDHRERTAEIGVEGSATGILMGGNLFDARACGGMGLPEFRGGDPPRRGYRQGHRAHRWFSSPAIPLGLPWRRPGNRRRPVHTLRGSEAGLDRRPAGPTVRPRCAGAGRPAYRSRSERASSPTGNRGEEVEAWVRAMASGEGRKKAVPYLANRSFGYMAMIYSWAIRRRLLRYTPFVGLEKPFAEQKRARTFSNDELRRLFEALKKAPKQIAGLWRLLFYTGNWLRETVKMEWAWIDDEKKSRTTTRRRPTDPGAWAPSCAGD